MQIALIAGSWGTGYSPAPDTAPARGSVRTLPPRSNWAASGDVDADVFAVAATTYEETSLAALEAVACGTPCVLTRQCEIPDLGVGGGVVTECDPEAFAAGLSAVLADPHRAERARFARERILATHTSARRADVYADLFRRVANGQSAKHAPRVSAR